MKSYPLGKILIAETGPPKEFLYSLNGQSYYQSVFFPINYSEYYEGDKTTFTYSRHRTHCYWDYKNNKLITKDEIESIFIFKHSTGHVLMYNEKEDLRKLLTFLKLEWSYKYIRLNYVDTSILERLLRGDIKNVRELIRESLIGYGIKGHVPIKKIIQFEIYCYTITMVYRHYKNPDYLIHNWNKIGNYYNDYYYDMFFGEKINAKWSSKRLKLELNNRKKIKTFYECLQYSLIKQLIRYNLIPKYYELLLER